VFKVQLVAKVAASLTTATLGNQAQGRGLSVVNHAAICSDPDRFAPLKYQKVMTKN
jgi:hypothetical protein